MKIYSFLVSEKNKNIVEVTISLKDNLYFTKCSCIKSDSSAKCRHIVSVIGGKSDSLNDKGSFDQKQLIAELMKNTSGLYLLNKMRIKVGNEPFCEKCKEPMMLMEEKKSGLMNKLFPKKSTEKIYVCTICNRKTVFDK